MKYEYNHSVRELNLMLLSQRYKDFQEKHLCEIRAESSSKIFVRITFYSNKCLTSYVTDALRHYHTVSFCLFVCSIVTSDDRFW